VRKGLEREKGKTETKMPEFEEKLREGEMRGRVTFLLINILGHFCTFSKSAQLESNN
jgi:hypothetical protein